MGERLREHYFLVVRIGVLLILEVYIVLSQSILTGTSGRVFLLLALFIGFQKRLLGNITVGGLK